MAKAIGFTCFLFYASWRGPQTEVLRGNQRTSCLSVPRMATNACTQQRFADRQPRPPPNSFFKPPLCTSQSRAASTVSLPSTRVKLMDKGRALGGAVGAESQLGVERTPSCGLSTEYDVLRTCTTEYVHTWT